MTFPVLEHNFLVASKFSNLIVLMHFQMCFRMETFQEAALQMLREFRALLQHTPVPLNANRFLQLLALNMFAIENTQLKGKCCIIYTFGS